MGKKQRSKRQRQEAQATKRPSRNMGAAIPLAREFSPAPFSWPLTLAICGIIAALVAIVFAQSGSFGFISLDDPQYVTRNPVVRLGLTLEGIRWAFTTGTFYWHPLTWMSHMLDVSLFGMKAGPQHVVSALIHLLNSLLLFAVMRKLTGAFWKSAIIALIFAVHPMHVESVAWISERKDVLSAFFWLATMYFYIGYARSGARRSMLVTVGLFALGILSKPMIVTLPLVLLLFDYWPLKRIETDESLVTQWLSLVREKIPFFVLSAISVFATLISQRGTRTVITTESLSIGDRIGNAMVSYCLYLWDFLWPLKLAAFYPLEPPAVAQSVGAFLLLTSLTMLAWRLGQQFRFLIVGWLWYLVVLLPVIGFVQAGDQGRADRFMYVPMIGILIIISWSVEKFVPATRMAKIMVGFVGALIVALLTITARTQAGFWNDDLHLWERTVAVTTDNYRAENSYGVALTDRGKLFEGIAHYLKAIEIWPDYPEAHNNLGTARRDEGRIDDAIAEFTRAAQLRPNSSTFHFNLGVVLSDKGDTTAAIREVEAAVRLEPGNSDYARALEMLRGTRTQ
jgi:hypothetical protein